MVIEVIVLCVDIIEWKKVEEELRVIKELLELLFGNFVDGIYIVDMEGKVIWINCFFENIFGWIEEEVVGKEVCFFFLDIKFDFVEISK